MASMGPSSFNDGNRSPPNPVVRLVGDVATKILILRLGPNEVVEPILLPESPGLCASLIDLSTREAFPCFTLRQHRIIIRKRSQQVDVIRHHDEIGQPIRESLQPYSCQRNAVPWRHQSSRHSPSDGYYKPGSLAGCSIFPTEYD